jgi:hypothetical protein
MAASMPWWWDHNLYALRTRDGSELWHFAMTDQPGSAYPNAGSVDVRRIDGVERVFVAGGETVYAVDALSREEFRHFDAGTGCGVPPGDSGFGGSAPETNEPGDIQIVCLFGPVGRPRPQPTIIERSQKEGQCAGLLAYC